MKQKFSTALLQVALFAVLSVFSFSCSDDDDKVNCNALYEDLVDAYFEFYEASDNEDCEAMEDLSQEVLSILNKGKNCDDLKEALADEGYDSVDEYIDEVEAEFESAMVDC